jgi:kumamolisin
VKQTINRPHVAAAVTMMAAALAGSASAAPDTAAQVTTTPRGTIVTPGSSIARPEDRGVAAHTNIHMFIPRGAIAEYSAPTGDFNNPASLACLYGLTTFVAGCNPETLTTVAIGGSKIVAIVDAYDDPTAANDLGVYSQEYGLPAVTGNNFEVVYASGTKPQQDPTGDWEVEESLDMEMVHALAPDAKIVLVEAKSNGNADLIEANKVASALVAGGGGGEVSNSWGESEFVGEKKFEKDFTGANVVFLAAAGDKPGTWWPSVLTNVISVGGTSINRDQNGNFVSQTTWASTGGGRSTYVKTPPYQSDVTKIVGKTRGTPDVGLIANPETGIWVYDSTPYEGHVLSWSIWGGTSVATPVIAGIINNAGAFNASTMAELTEIYASLGVNANFTPIKKGSCLNAKSGKASKGYDLCTGIGTPLGLAGK